MDLWTQNSKLRTSTEWLLTNGIGGYAMGTLPGINTRRYHGLLVAATSPPVGRVVALHSIIEEIRLGDRTIALSSQRFGNEAIVHPDGARLIEDVTVDLPHKIRWRYRIDDAFELMRTLRLAPGRNLALLSWRFSAEIPAETRLVLYPLIALRDFHALNRAGDMPLTSLAVSRNDPRTIRIARGDPPAIALDLTISSGSVTETPDWWRDFAYLEDRDRGQDWHEDVFTPGRFEIPIEGSAPIELHAELTLPARFEVRTRAHDASPSHPLTPSSSHRFTLSPSHRTRLRAAASQFIVHRKVGNEDSTSIIAGYPWFADWGRDTMIALPGLLLTTGRFDEAERALLTFGRHMRGGLIPNHFDDSGGAHYNTVDASLWFIHAVSELLDRAPGAVSRGELLDACRTIICAYREGTDYNIRMDPADALIAAGDENMQLTWMDAQRDGVTFTPRHGKAIEINALWHHALHCFAEMSDRDDKAQELCNLRGRVARSIQRLFWNEETSCCYDVLTPDGENWIGDAAIRPNQVFAVSLAPSPLGQARQRSILRVVKEKLLTSFGLRTLDPAEPSYRGRFEGTLFNRDGAYHQGTVWPWLIGPYCEAVLRVGNFSERARREVARTIEPLLDEMDGKTPGTCIGQIAEVYDGEAPHRAGGCPAQAWSVAELLRVIEMLDRAGVPRSSGEAAQAARARGGRAP